MKKFLISRRMKRNKVQFPLHCKIHGVKSIDRQGAIAQTRAEDKLQLVHVPLPDYPYNVYAYNISLNRILGYLDEGLSVKLISVFGKRFCRDGEVDKITGGEQYPYRGCNIKIYETAEFLKDNRNFQHLHGE